MLGLSEHITFYNIITYEHNSIIKSLRIKGPGTPIESESKNYGLIFSE